MKADVLCVYKHMIYSDGENYHLLATDGKGVNGLKVDDCVLVMTCDQEDLPEEGEVIEVKGVWVIHKKYGKQIQVDSYKEGDMNLFFDDIPTSTPDPHAHPVDDGYNSCPSCGHTW